MNLLRGGRYTFFSKCIMHLGWSICQEKLGLHHFWGVTPTENLRRRHTREHGELHTGLVADDGERKCWAEWRSTPGRKLEPPTPRRGLMGSSVRVSSRGFFGRALDVLTGTWSADSLRPW
jgi:hypothetical protein